VDNPERVHGLVLICTAESFAAYPWMAMLPLAEENWDLFLRLQTKNVPPALVENVIHDFKTSATPAEFTRMIRAFAASDVSEVLPRLQTPTLMIHSLRQHWLSPEEGVKTAAKIAGARIFFPEAGDTEPEPSQGARMIVDFLQELPAFESKSGAGSPRRLAIALSVRQRDVLRLVAEGRTTREIAEALVLSERTVERHIADVYAKIGARNRAEATAYALSQFR
jgi:DNA-binding CsgD family transcriptional regulator